MRQLFLGQAEEKIGLVLAGIRRPLQDPARSLRIVLIASVVAGSNLLRPNLPGGQQQLVELQVVVAQAAGNGRAPGEVFVDEGANHIALEALLVVHHVVGNRQHLRHPPGVVYVVDRAAASLHLLRHSILVCQPALVPQLHGQPDQVVSLRLEHGRHG